MNFNKVMLGGRLTRDPEIRHTQGGMQIGKLGLAVNERWQAKDGGEKREKTHFVDLVAFGRTAEVLHEHLHRGDPIFVEGRLQFSSWEDKDGQKRNKLEVVVDRFEFVGGKRDEGSRGGGRSQPASNQSHEHDDIQF